MLNSKKYLRMSNWFNDIIVNSDKNLMRLKAKLEGLSENDLIRFQFEFNALAFELCPNEDIFIDFLGEKKLINHEEKMDFTFWAISMGISFLNEIQVPERDLSSMFKECFTYSHYLKDKSTIWDCEGGSAPELIAYDIFELKYDGDLWEIDNELQDSGHSLSYFYSNDEEFFEIKNIAP